MKFIAERRPSPFRRRHPTAEEIVEEVYRRVQEQQQQQLEADLQLRSNYQAVVDRRVRLPVDDRSDITRIIRKDSPLDSKKQPSASTPSPKRNHGNTQRKEMSGSNTNQQKQRSITPFRRLRRPPPQVEVSTSVSSTEVNTDFPSLSPQQASTIARVSTAKSTTFLPVEDEEVSIVQWEQSITDISKTPSNRRVSEDSRKTPQSTSWNPRLRTRMSVEAAGKPVTNIPLKPPMDSSRHARERPSAANVTVRKSTRIVENSSQRPMASFGPKTLRSLSRPSTAAPIDRKARSVSPFFGRRRKAASVLIAEAEQRALELSSLPNQPIPSQASRLNRSRSSNRIDDESDQSTQRSFSPSKKLRTARSLSPFTRRKRADELISEVYQTFDTAERTVKADQPIEDAIELILAPSISKSPQRKRFGKLPSLESPCSTSDSLNHPTSPSDKLQTVATVQLKAPLALSNTEKRKFKAVKSFRGRKSFLLPDPNERTATTTSNGTKTTAVSDTTVSTDLNATAVPVKTPKSRSLIRLSSRNGEDKEKYSNVSLQKSLSKCTDASKSAREASGVLPPSSILLGRRSRVSELSTVVPNSLVDIPLSSNVKKRSLGERSVAELQSALEKVQQELIGAKETGQKVPMDLVLDHLLAVADTIEATDDRHTVQRKLSRLGSLSIARSLSSNGKRYSQKPSGSVSDESDVISDDEDTTTDQLETSGDESSFSRWFGSGKSVGEDSSRNTGRWAQILDALGLSDFFGADADMDYDLDLSRDSIFEESNDRELTDDDEASAIIEIIETPPDIQKTSFKSFFGKISNIGSSREENLKLTQHGKDEQEQQADVFRQRDEAQRRREIHEEEQMFRELEEMDVRIRSEQKFGPSIKASGRLKKMAHALRQENETLNLGIDENYRVKHSPDREEGKIEMYVQDITAEKQKAASEEQMLRRAIESEIVKQSLTNSVLKKVNARVTEVPLKSGSALQPSGMGKKRRSWGRRQHSRDSMSNPVTHPPEDIHRIDSNNDVFDCALSLGSIESHQFSHRVPFDFDAATISCKHNDASNHSRKEVRSTPRKLEPMARRLGEKTKEYMDEARSDFSSSYTKRGTTSEKTRRMV